MQRFASDVAFVDDGFGPTRAGDQVARIALEAEAPFTIGVTGKWGAGKTSVLRRAFVTLGGVPLEAEVPLGGPHPEVEEDAWKHLRYGTRPAELGWDEALLEEASRSLCVWFSPWQHQHAANPLLPLLHEMRAQYTTWIKVKCTLNDANRRGGLAGLALLERVIDGAASLVTGSQVQLATGTTEAVRTAWRSAAPLEPDLDDGQRLMLLFEDAVKNLIDGLHETSGQAQDKMTPLPGRLIIFIDDLDRCEEDAVVKLLEAIKLYLGSRRTVFILGVDEAAVLSALARFWPDRSPDDNREYLDKLFQAVLPVPLPRPEKVLEAVTERLKAHGFPEPATCAKMVVDVIEPNPRKIKTFLNSACASWALFGQRCEAGESDPLRFAQRFLLFHYLRSYHNAIWRLLERQPWVLRFLSVALGVGAPQSVGEIEGVDVEDQRILRLLIKRSFAHVLRDTGGVDDRHHALPLDKAVGLLTERLDRKRSDDAFRLYYKGLVDPMTDLPDELLYLPDAPEPDHA